MGDGEEAGALVVGRRELRIEGSHDALQPKTVVVTASHPITATRVWREVPWDSSATA